MNCRCCVSVVSGSKRRFVSGRQKADRRLYTGGADHYDRGIKAERKRDDDQRDHELSGAGRIRPTLQSKMDGSPDLNIRRTAAGVEQMNVRRQGI